MHLAGRILKSRLPAFMRALDYIDLRKKGNDDREQIAPEADRRVHVPRRHG